MNMVEKRDHVELGLTGLLNTMVQGWQRGKKKRLVGKIVIRVLTGTAKLEVGDSTLQAVKPRGVHYSH